MVPRCSRSQPLPSKTFSARLTVSRDAPSRRASFSCEVCSSRPLPSSARRQPLLDALEADRLGQLDQPYSRSPNWLKTALRKGGCSASRRSNRGAAAAPARRRSRRRRARCSAHCRAGRRSTARRSRRGRRRTAPSSRPVGQRAADAHTPAQDHREAAAGVALVKQRTARRQTHDRQTCAAVRGAGRAADRRATGRRRAAASGASGGASAGGFFTGAQCAPPGRVGAAAVWQACPPEPKCRETGVPK